MTFLILKVLDLTIGIRVAEDEEELGLDITQHGEEAYTHGEGALLLLDRRVDHEARSAHSSRTPS